VNLLKDEDVDFFRDYSIFLFSNLFRPITLGQKKIKNNLGYIKKLPSGLLNPLNSMSGFGKPFLILKIQIFIIKLIFHSNKKCNYQYF